MRVEAVWNETGFYTDPAVCGADYEWCIKGNLEGSLNGEMWLFSHSDLAELYDPYDMGIGSIQVGASHQYIYTQDGEVQLITHGLYETETTVFTELSVVTGGTGKFAGATGQMVAYPDASKPSNYHYSGPLYYKGRICTE